MDQTPQHDRTADGVTELAARTPQLTPEEVADRQRERFEAAPHGRGGFETPNRDALLAVRAGLERWL
ncbi:hypothetical protein ACFC3O_31630 [Streptomyces sp. NPDC056007]|uniref:hypothetical protein n=1 Tax=Streptomyces sp. NPDC056007 TaxID=3345678 RepID=UPI0035D9A406